MPITCDLARRITGATVTMQYACQQDCYEEKPSWAEVEFFGVVDARGLYEINPKWKQEVMYRCVISVELAEQIRSNEVSASDMERFGDLLWTFEARPITVAERLGWEEEVRSIFAVMDHKLWQHDRA
jgi:hypothetical protein